MTTALATGCSDDGDDKSSKHTVVYEAEGTGPVEVKYSIDEPDSDGEEVKDAQLPWSKTIEVTTPGTYMFMALYASPLVSPDETITCRVKVDGKVVSEKTGKRGDSSNLDSCTADFSEPDFVEKTS